MGERIPTEAELVEQLGVGRGTVREAVRALTYSGILEVRRGYGTFVRSDTETSDALQRRLLQSDHHEVFEVRRALEVEAALLAAQRRTEEDLEAIENALERRTAAVRTSTSTSSSPPTSPSIKLSSWHPTTGAHPAVRGVRAKLSADLRRQCAALPEGALPDVDHRSIVAAIRAQDAEQAAHAALSTCPRRIRRIHRRPDSEKGCSPAE
ncbi:GntR family transcriptional regulator [Rhodococcus hoagii]|nr:GntR family transcriptional regulator [Prescottella equi]